MTLSQKDKDKIVQMSATAMAQAVQQRELSVTELVEAHIQRIEAVNGDINAVIIPLYDEARKTAHEADNALASNRGKWMLFGVPMTIKDQFLLKRTPTSLGLDHLSYQTSSQEGPLVARLREQGAVFLGKTNVPELCLTHECIHARFGPTNNPWDLQRVPGGSSGGEAAIIASKGSPLGLGGDMGGSIRVPCHLSGISGLKPTTGRFPNSDTPLNWQIWGAFAGFEAYVAQPGPMARHVDDLKLMMDALFSHPLQTTEPYPPVPWSQGPIPSIGDLRIGYYTHHPYFPASPAIRRVVMEGVEILSSQGVDVVPFDFPEPNVAYDLAISLISAAGATWIKSALKNDSMTPTVKNLRSTLSIPSYLRPLLSWILNIVGQKRAAQMIKSCTPLSADGYQVLVAKRTQYRVRFIQSMIDQGVDILIAPPYALPAPLHNADETGTVTAAACYAIMFNLLGNPAGVVAASRVREEEQGKRKASKEAVFRTATKCDEKSAGLPVGVQVIGKHWREDEVLSVMKRLETGFKKREGYPDLEYPALSHPLSHP